MKTKINTFQWQKKLFGTFAGACINECAASWGWVATACTYSCYTQKERCAAAKIGVAIGVIYATIINIVYFTQLTTVLHKSADDKILQVFAFTSAGSWLFNLDLLVYRLLSISTFFVGFTLQTEKKNIGKSITTE